MKFYVLTNDGRKFGPADIPTLNAWIKENRLNRETELEHAETGRKHRARDVAGLDFPAASVDLGGNDPIIKAHDPLQQTQQTQQQAPSGQPGSYVAGQPMDQPQEQPQGQPQGQSPYQAAPQPGGNYPQQSYSNADDGSQKMVTTAWILIGVGFVLCLSVILCPFAIYQAKRAKTMGNPNAQAPLVVAWVLFSLSLVGCLTFGIPMLIGFVGALS